MPASAPQNASRFRPSRRTTPPAVASPAEPGARRVEPLVFAVLLLLQLVPLVLLRHLGTQDGPSHLATSRVLLDHGDSAHPIYGQYYWLDAFPSPNLLTEGLLTALVAVFPPEVAEKILAGGYLLALPLALRFVLRRIDPSATWLAYAAFPLTRRLPVRQRLLELLLRRRRLRARRGLGASPAGAAAASATCCASRGWLLLAYVTHFIPAVLLALLALVPAARRGTRRRACSLGPQVADPPRRTPQRSADPARRGCRSRS